MGVGTPDRGPHVPDTRRPSALDGAPAPGHRTARMKRFEIATPDEIRAIYQRTIDLLKA